VTDPNTSKAQGLSLYDSSGNLLNNANPNGYLIVPENYSVDQATSFGSQVASDMLNFEVGVTTGLGTMIGAFITGGPQDLQRTYTDINGNTVSNGAAVSAFQDAASPATFNMRIPADGTPEYWADRLYPIASEITPTDFRILPNTRRLSTRRSSKGGCEFASMVRGPS
jgi:hypothetical protein